MLAKSALRVDESGTGQKTPCTFTLLVRRRARFDLALARWTAILHRYERGPVPTV